MHNKEHDLMWQQLLAGVQRGTTPLQVQLRTLFVTAILDGRLRPGLRLPSGRELAALAGLARNTVVLTYERLVEEGYLEARPRDGFFIREMADDALPSFVDAHPVPGLPDWLSRMPSQEGQLRWLDRPSGWRSLRYPFVFGQFDASLFPLAEWRECSRQALNVSAVHKWAQDGTSADSPQLIEQLIRRVLPRRGITARPEQILLTLGTQHGLYLIGELFGRQEASFGVEDPGYMDARNIFGRCGGRLVSLPLDAQGLALSEALRGCDYVYCTPSHQCPTGITMSQARRKELLGHALQHDYVIIEDDYDPETQYAGKPSPALKAIDAGGRVIYLSSLSKLLSPGLRLGYIVAPEVVIERLRLLRRLMIRQAPGNNQLAAALFIEQGHYDRLLQRTRAELGRRAAVLVAALRKHLPQMQFAPPQGGSSLWLRLPDGVDPHLLNQEALRRGVVFDPSGPFFAEQSRQSYIRIGYSSIAEALIDPGIGELAGAVRSICSGLP